MLDTWVGWVEGVEAVMEGEEGVESMNIQILGHMPRGHMHQNLTVIECL